MPRQGRWISISTFTSRYGTWLRICCMCTHMTLSDHRTYVYMHHRFVPRLGHMGAHGPASRPIGGRPSRRLRRKPLIWLLHSMHPVVGSIHARYHSPPSPYDRHSTASLEAQRSHPSCHLPARTHSVVTGTCAVLRSYRHRYTLCRAWHAVCKALRACMGNIGLVLPPSVAAASSRDVLNCPTRRG